MRRRVTVAVVVATAVTAGWVAYAAVAAGSDVPGRTPGQGTLTAGISFPGLDTGATATIAGDGEFRAGAAVANMKVQLAAYTIPNAGGGQDENHVLALIRGYFPGYWIVGARVTPFTSGYSQPVGLLTVWLNKPAATTIPFSYMEFGIFQD